MNTRSKGNVALLYVGLILSAMLALPAVWGQIQLSSVGTGASHFGTADVAGFDQMLGEMTLGLTLPVHGLGGRIESLGFPLPYWIGPLCVVGGATLLLMNLYQLGDFDSSLLLGLFGLGLMVAVGAATEILIHGSISPGIAWAFVGPLGGLILAWRIKPAIS